MRNAECPVCGAGFDPLLAPVRVIDGQVASVCGRCPEGIVAVAQVEAVAEQVAAEPVISPSIAKRVVQRQAERPVAPPVDVCIPVPIELTVSGRVRLNARRRKVTLAVVASAAALLLGGVWAWQTGPAVGLAASAAGERSSTSLTNDSLLSLNRQITTREPATLAELDKRVEEPIGKGPLGTDWIYPLPGSKKWRTTMLGSFGARRPGRRPRECRRGHCGVDLHGPRGMPVVSILPGKVTYIGRNRWKRSGKFVRVTHPSGMVSSYMHLDRIGKGLQVGQAISAGMQVGTLGRTGIRTSPAHLHFSVSLDRKHSRYYFDPAAALRRARMIERPRF